MNDLGKDYPDDAPRTKKRGCLGTLGIILLTVVISVIASIFAVNYLLFPSKLAPVKLSQVEESTLNSKLKRFGLPTFIDDSGEISISFHQTISTQRTGTRRASLKGNDM